MRLLYLPQRRGALIRLPGHPKWPCLGPASRCKHGYCDTNPNDATDLKIVVNGQGQATIGQQKHKHDN